MKDESGLELARRADTTDHGGTVIKAGPDLIHEGTALMLDGHLIACPACGGAFPVIATGPFVKHGVRVARIGDRTLCGAVLTRN